MSGWWVHTVWERNPAELVSHIVWVILAVVLHELAHGWMAIRKGDRTPIETGHMTWNPLVHMGGMSLAALAIVGIAWGAMPVNPSRLRGRHADALVSLAGPMMNLALALVSTLLGMVWIGVAGGHWIPSVEAGDPLFQNMVTFFVTGAWLNVLLMVFNLIPIPPLDGSRILSHYSPEYRRVFESENGQWIGLGLFILLFFWGSRYIFGWAYSITSELWGALGNTLGFI